MLSVHDLAFPVVHVILLLSCLTVDIWIYVSIEAKIQHTYFDRHVMLSNSDSSS